MSKHRASRRELRRSRRVGVRPLVLGVGAVALVASAGFGVVSQLDTRSAATDVAAGSAQTPAPSALEASGLALVDPSSGQADGVAADVAADSEGDAVADSDVAALQAEVESARTVDPGLPAASGSGRRIVFSQSDQRVWLVGDSGVERSYLVSGSRFDNLKPGSYRVQSKTRDATAFDASGTMEYFVRFATGFSEPIGFHSVPRDNDGVLEQTKAQLGTPLSAGCVRQWKPDAIALWDFAPVGTPVVVTP